MLYLCQRKEQRWVCFSSGSLIKNMEFAKILKMAEAFNRLVNSLPKDDKGNYFVKDNQKIHMVTIMVFEPHEFNPKKHRGKYMIFNENDEVSYQTLDELLRCLTYYGILMSDFLNK